MSDSNSPIPECSSSPAPTAPSPTPSTSLISLDRIRIDPERNDRLDVDRRAIADLADSIQRLGLLQPLLVRQVDDAFDLVAGHRRYAALRILGHTTAPVHVVPLSDPQLPAVRLDENLHRSDLTPLEIANALYRVQHFTNATHSELAARFGRSEQWIDRYLSLVAFPPELQQALHDRKISIAVAQELALVESPEHGLSLLDAAINHGCTAVQARLWRVTANTNPAQPPTAHSPNQPPPLAGGATRVSRECFICREQADVTTMTYTTICPTCAAGVAAAKR